MACLVLCHLENTIGGSGQSALVCREIAGLGKWTLKVMSFLANDLADVTGPIRLRQLVSIRLGHSRRVPSACLLR
jgi:hypothetical protein